MLPKKDPNIELGRYYHLRLAAAYVRGKLNRQNTSDGLFETPLAQLSARDCENLCRQGLAAGLRLHRFKRTGLLPRVNKVLGSLKLLQPLNLLDIGTGRGVFLWPLLEAFPLLPITCIDLLWHRITDIQAVTQGGIDKLQALHMDAVRLAFKDRTFDGVTLLEILEHVQNPQALIQEVCRVANRFIILSVPSKADNNPEHLHLFTTDKLRSLFNTTGEFKIKFGFVLNHITALAMRT